MRRHFVVLNIQVDQSVLRDAMSSTLLFKEHESERNRHRRRTRVAGHADPDNAHNIPSLFALF